MSIKKLLDYKWECVFYYFKLFGIATMNFKIRTSDRWLFNRSRSGVVYNTFLIFLMVISCVSSVFNIWNSGKSLFQKIIDIIQVLINSFTGLFITFKFCVQQEKFIQMNNKISLIRESLMLMSRKEISKKCSIFRYIFGIFLTITIFFCLLMVSTLMDNYNHWTVLLKMFRYWNFFAFLTLMLQYSVFLKLIQQLFKLINENLLDFSKKYVFGSHFMESHFAALQLNRIAQICRLYATLKEASQDLSDFYSEPILFCIIRSFITLTFGSYESISPLVFGRTDLIRNSYINLLLRDLLIIMLIIILTKSVTATVIEVKLFETI